MIVVWDEPKRLANIAKHGLDFADLSYEFFLSAKIGPARDGRLKAVGTLADGTIRRDFRYPGLGSVVGHFHAPRSEG